MSSLQLQAVEALVRLDENFDVPLLDRVVAAFYQGHGPDVSFTLSFHFECKLKLPYSKKIGDFKCFI